MFFTREISMRIRQTAYGRLKEMSAAESLDSLADQISLGKQFGAASIGLLHRRGFSDREMELIVNGLAMAGLTRLITVLLEDEKSSDLIRESLLMLAAQSGVDLSPEVSQTCLLQTYLQLCVILSKSIKGPETLAELQQKSGRGFGNT
jgi:hypothetical protein